MLSVYVKRGTSLERVPVEAGISPPDDAVWIDMVMPTAQEDRMVENLVGIAVPTRYEIRHGWGKARPRSSTTPGTGRKTARSH